MTRNIVVTNPVSTGQFFIGDIIHRGYKPIILDINLPEDDPIDKDKGIQAYKSIPYDVDIINEKATYEETLEMVKSYNPVLVLAGSENGVILATKLSEDLGLPGNPAKNLPEMTKKQCMHEALKKAGLRYIEGKVVKTVEDGISYYLEKGFKRAVVKPVHSAGSQGLFFCDSKEELENAIKELLSMRDFIGDSISEVLIQERIVGTEYIVNTVSCRGHHKLSSVLRYTKVPTKEGGNIYDYLTTIVDLEPGHTDMISYAFKVADAIGYQYGEIHGEYIIDEKGPVLVEVNCRPMGGSCPPAWLDKVFGQHEIDSILDAYLEPDYFLSEIHKPYHPQNMAAIKFIMVPKEIEAESLPIYEIAKNLRSFYKISAKADHTSFHLSKTRDMYTHGGEIYLVHEDAKVVEDDIKLLKEIEANDFELMINDGASRPWFKKDGSHTDLKKLLHECNCHGSVLLVTDDDVSLSGVMISSYEKLREADAGYKNVVIDINSSIINKDESDVIKMIFDIMKRVQVGGRVIFTEQCYYYLTAKKRGAETLLRVLGYRIEAPLYGCENIVIGLKCQ